MTTLPGRSRPGITHLGWKSWLSCDSSGIERTRTCVTFVREVFHEARVDVVVEGVDRQVPPQGILLWGSGGYD